MNDEEFRALMGVIPTKRFAQPRVTFMHSEAAEDFATRVEPEPEDLPLRQGEVGTYIDARFHRQLETLRLDRWHHPTPDRYYTGDARMPVPPMSMLRPMVRLLAGG